MLFDIECTICKLGRGRTVPGEGPTVPRLIVVSDYPGAKEGELRRPFMGESGNLLRNALRNVVGLDVEKDVFFTNALKCAPLNEKVTPKELGRCRKWLDKELTLVQSRVILIAGDQARLQLLPTIKGAINKLHGSVYVDPLKSWRYFLTWNPAYVHQFSSFDSEGRRNFHEGSVPWLFLQDMLKLKEIL